MATMRWKNISLPIAQGVDTKTDSKALQPGKLANLENCALEKRKAMFFLMATSITQSIYLTYLKKLGITQEIF